MLVLYQWYNIYIIYQNVSRIKKCQEQIKLSTKIVYRIKSPKELNYTNFCRHLYINIETALTYIILIPYQILEMTISFGYSAGKKNIFNTLRNKLDIL